MTPPATHWSVRLLDWVLPAVGSLFSDAASDASLLGKLFIRTPRPSTDPSRLGVDGYHLVECVDQPGFFVPPHFGTTQEARDEYLDNVRTRHGIKNGEDICALLPTYPKTGSLTTIPSNNLYSEKTHDIGHT